MTLPEPYYADVSTTLYAGDCLDVLAAMDAESVDAVVTDPPYGLEFMGREWDRIGDIGRATHQGISDGSFKGFKVPQSYNASSNVKCQRCSKWKWDHEGRKCECGPEAAYPNVRAHQGRTMQAWHERWAAACLRVLKPGGHLLAFGGSRTYHRLAGGVEDAGFEVRDQLQWLYGSGFPKSLNLDGEWDGWGTALKPAHEPIVMARKPLAGTVAVNVQAHTTGALNIDGCRIAADGDHRAKCESVVGLDSNRNGYTYGEWTGERESSWSPAGRWPANVVLDGYAADMLDQQSGYQRTGRVASHSTAGMWGSGEDVDYADDDPGGGASRFFYVAKASRAERDASNHHPTVKPVALMRWLIRLVTPPDGLVLDPFAGSGTTGIAAAVESKRCVLIEREPEYAHIAVRRLSKPIEPTLDVGGAA